MSRCFPYPPPGYEKKKKNISNGEELEHELDLGYPDKNAKDKDKKEKEKKKNRKEKNKDDHKLETEKSEKKHKHKHHKHKKDEENGHNKQNKDDINKVLTRDMNGGHGFEDKNGVVDAKGILNKVEPKSRKFSGNIENGRCGKIYLSESEGTMQRVDKERKSEVESWKIVGIDGLGNGKCDMIDLSDKENSKQKVDENKQLESMKSAMIESLKNGKCNKTELSNRKGSKQKVDKDKKLVLREFAGTERHENGKFDKIDLSSREALRKQVDKDKKLEVESRNSAGIERLKDGKSIKTHLPNGKGSMQHVNKDKKLEVEIRTSAGTERHQNGKCDKIDLSASQGSRKNMDTGKKLEVELKRCAAGIGRLENGRCDEICKSDREGFTQKLDKGMTRDNDRERDQKILMDRTKSNGIGKKRKEMETTSSLHIESIKRLKNGKCTKIDWSDRQGSIQNVIKETVRDNEIARDKETFKDLAKSEGIRKKRKEMDPTDPSHGNGLWINLPVLTDKDKRSIKRPRIEPAEEVYHGNGRTVQEAKYRALGCIHESGVQDASNAAVEKCISSACHLPVAAKECGQTSRSRVDDHVQDFSYFYSVPQKLDWSEVDDQAWLFHSSGGKPKITVKIDHGSTVWAQAKQLQHNIYALPYVMHL